MNWMLNPVGYYLMSCYAYEQLNDAFLPDAEFDKLGQYIEDHWFELDHRHKYLIDYETCAHTSGVTRPYGEFPIRILSATHAMLGYEPTGVAGSAYQKALTILQLT